MRIREWLKNHAPDFMWCTVHELFVMYEQLNWDVEWDNFRQSFYQVQKRYFEKQGNKYKRRT